MIAPILGNLALASSIESDVCDVIWGYSVKGFGKREYEKSVEALILQYEEVNGKVLAPGEKGRVGLKVYAQSGPGLATPKDLVRGVVKALERRGYRKKDIFIVGLRAVQLRRCGYLPPISKGGSRFEGMDVYALDRNMYWDSEWYYSSPLPSKDYLFRPEQRKGAGSRKSFLPAPLFLDVDFWINMPVVTSHKATGVSGALVNATLYNISNSGRFFDNPATAAVAIAEIAAIPEFKETWAFTLMSMEQMQFIGGRVYNANYTDSENWVLLTENAPALDYVMLRKIDSLRKEHGLKPIAATPTFFKYTRQLDVGDYEAIEIREVR